VLCSLLCCHGISCHEHWRSRSLDCNPTPIYNHVK
jgi:hypothetical protein